MKNYIVTFTNDASEYDLNHQQKAIREELKNNQNYFSNINAEIDYDLIDREVESAIRNNFDNFICLAEDEDIDMLQDGLEAEYGDKFNEILVIPEEFARLTEIGIAPQNTQGQQQQNTQVQQVRATNTANLLETLKKLDNGTIKGPSFDLTQFANKVIYAVNHQQIDNYVKYFTLAYYIYTCNSQNQNIISAEINKSTYTISLNSNINKAFLSNKESIFNTNQPKPFYFAATKEFKGVKQDVQISIKSEQKISNATNIHLILFNINYPFKDLTVSALQNIQQIRDTALREDNSDVLFMISGPLPNQQFLNASKVFPIACEVPDDTNTLEQLFKNVMPANSVMTCGVPTMETVASGIAQNFQRMAPACQRLTIHLPKSLSGLEKLPNTIAASATYQTTATIDLQDDFSPDRNQLVYKALDELATDKDNNFRNCKSSINNAAKEQEKQAQQEVTDEIQGKEAKDVEKLGKKLNKDLENGALSQEMSSPWPPFVLALIEATIDYKKNPNERGMTPEQLQAAQHEFIDAVLAPLKKDAASWKTALDATGFGVMASWVYNAGKALFKNKKAPREDKNMKKIKNLVTTDAYITIKEQFGGTYNKASVLKDQENAIKAERVAQATQGNQDLDKAGVVESQS